MPLLLLPLYGIATSLTPRLAHRRLSRSAEKHHLAMDSSRSGSEKELPLGIDPSTEEEYNSQSKLLKEFNTISSIDKAWAFKSNSGSQGMFLISQSNLLANKRRKFMLSTSISQENTKGVNFQWAPFPIEMIGVSTIVPSPSGSKILVIRNPENESPSIFEIWSQSQLDKEFQIPQSVHGSVYTDGWFEGISWNCDESLIAYIAEEPSPSKPIFDDLGYKKGGSKDKDCGSWKGQGDWQEEWGESFAGKRQPALFVMSVKSGKVQVVKGIEKHLSVGQVVWGPPTVDGADHFLVFVGWSAKARKLGMIYCYNRPCALYAVKAPLYKPEADEFDLESSGDSTAINLTQCISSAYFPRFSPDGKYLVFMSAKSSVDSGAHSATESLHKIEWPTDGKVNSSEKVIDVIPVVHSAEDSQFPGIYGSSFLRNPWLSDGHTMIFSSIWHSCQVVLSVNVSSGQGLRISPTDSNNSWKLLALDGDNVIALCSSPVDLPELKYGCLVDKATWNWSTVSSPLSKCSEKVKSLLSSLQFSILKIPVKDASDCLTNGSAQPFEAIFVSSSSKKNALDPLIAILHGGPHSASLSSFIKSYAFLASIGFNLLFVNYRGSLGFGEEALQSLPGKIGFQDVNDVLTAIDHVIEKGLADPLKIAVLGGSHGGFLTTHLIGQAPDKFFAAAARNPVCDLVSMVGTTDIPDWCYVEAYGSKGLSMYTEAPLAEHLSHFYSMSPTSHLAKVKTPTLFLLGAQDLRVPVSNGLQYARAVREKGVETKVIVFPSDNHPIDRPQSDFESFLNIGVWFKKYCK